MRAELYKVVIGQDKRQDCSQVMTGIIAGKGCSTTLMVHQQITSEVCTDHLLGGLVPIWEKKPDKR